MPEFLITKQKATRDW